MKSIGIIGGGAGGMCAAIAASKRAYDEHSDTKSGGIEVHLFERNPRLGIKILISGGGKCNITHEGPVDQVLKFGFLQKSEERFLKSALYRFTNEDVLRLLGKYNLKWHARENGRIFPDSSRAEDVLRVFEQELRANQVILHTRTHIQHIAKLADKWEIGTQSERQTFDALILATGGTSYRKVGTTGDGIHFAKAIGHTIVPLRPALAPIYLRRPPVQDLVGTALRNAELLIARNDKILSRLSGDLLLTHRGVSGPVTLDISRDAALHLEEGPIQLQVNFLNRNEESVREELQLTQNARPQQQVKTWIEEILPNRLAPFVLDQAGIPHDRKWNALTREERTRLHRAVTRYDLGDVAEIPIDKGEVTAGGVSLKEVDPKTMMSRLHRGLFFAGEMLDIAGEIGGYNLQAAYSTGYVAGEAAAEMLL